MEFTNLAMNGIGRCESWRAAMTEAFGPFEVRPGEGRFAGQMRYARRGGLQFNDLHYAGQSIERTRANVAGLSEEFFTFGKPLSGPLRVLRSGSEFEVGPGCLYLMNQSLPYRALADGDCGFRSLSISIPGPALALRTRHLAPFYKIELSARSPKGTMLDAYLQNIFGNLDSWTDAELDLICERFIDLVALFLAQDDASHAFEADSSVTLGHRNRILSYIKLHLADPDLDAEKVAHGCSISVSYFYRILKLASISAESYISASRLDKAHEFLASPRLRHCGIAELCYQCGFRHPAHFSRLFKQRFGETPRDYRARVFERRSIASPQ